MADGRDAVGLAVGIPKRQARQGERDPKDDLDKLGRRPGFVGVMIVSEEVSQMESVKQMRKNTGRGNYPKIATWNQVLRIGSC